jgi:PAS domain-containing protein
VSGNSSVADETSTARPVTSAVEPWVETDIYGRVISASPDGARLFNLTVKGLTGRNLSLFFSSRQLIASRLQSLRWGQTECAPLEIDYRPMECRQRSLRIMLGSVDGDAVRWTLSEVVTEGVTPLLNRS